MIQIIWDKALDAFENQNRRSLNMRIMTYNIFTDARRRAYFAVLRLLLFLLVFLHTLCLQHIGGWSCSNCHSELVNHLCPLAALINFRFLARKLFNKQIWSQFNVTLHTSSKRDRAFLLLTNFIGIQSQNLVNWDHLGNFFASKFMLGFRMSGIWQSYFTPLTVLE